MRVFRTSDLNVRSLVRGKKSVGPPFELQIIMHPPAGFLAPPRLNSEIKFLVLYTPRERVNVKQAAQHCKAKLRFRGGATGVSRGEENSQLHILKLCTRGRAHTGG